jgi:ABC-type transport system involved in multi-copper enzyme maturation permease subunit
MVCHNVWERSRSNSIRDNEYMKPILAWLRRQFAWSNSRRSWYERAGATALLAVGAGGWWVSEGWSIEGRVLLLAWWLVLLAVLVRRGIVRLAGPVFFFEVLRGSRRRVHAIRVTYALILFLLLTYGYYAATVESYGPPTLQTQANLASTFFAVFFGVQMLSIGLAAPIMFAGAIAEEKERRTLEFVLATDLRSREIVLGKLAARLANILLLLLAGLPVLAFLQFFGGIDPGELLAAFVVLLVTLLSTASLSLLMSALLKRARDAILSTFLLMIAYLVLSGLANALNSTSFGAESVSVGGWRIYGSDLVDVGNAGNPIAGLASLSGQLDNGGAFTDVLRDVVWHYVLFHGGLAVLCLGWAALRLRPVALGYGAENKNSRRQRKYYRPAIDNHPMIWKEIFVESGLRLHIVLRLLMLLIVIASFWPPVRITYDFVDELRSEARPYRYYKYDPNWNRHYDPWGSYRREMNVWVRGMSGVVGTLLLLSVAMRAAGSVTGERGRQTLDELLTTPLTNREIIFSKWLGAIVGVRWGWVWLGAAFFVGICSGGLNVFAGMATILAWFGFAMFFAALGLWYSVSCKGSAQATTLTMVSSLFCLGLHWLLTALCCFLPLGLSGSRESDGILELIRAVELGFTPPFTLGACAMESFEMLADLRENAQLIAVMQFLGPPTFPLVGFAILNGATHRFALRHNRVNVRRPEISSPPKSGKATAE